MRCPSEVRGALRATTSTIPTMFALQTKSILAAHRRRPESEWPEIPTAADDVPKPTDWVKNLNDGGATNPAWLDAGHRAQSKLRPTGLCARAASRGSL